MYDLDKIEFQLERSIQNPPSDPRVVEISRAPYYLAMGNIAACLESLAKIDGPGALPEVNVELYSWLVETDSASVDAERYRSLLEHYDRSQFVEDDQKRWARAHYHLVTSDSEGLKQLLLASPVDSAPQVSGYINLLLARLDNSVEYARLAVAQLDRAIEPLLRAQPDDLILGRLAWHLGNANLLLYGLSQNQEERSNALEMAEIYAEVARIHLELHRSPILFGRAMDLNARVLAAQLDIMRAGRNSNRQADVLEKRMERMKALAAEYQ